MSNALTGLSDALADAVSKSGVGVVRVEGRDRVPLQLLRDLSGRLFSCPFLDQDIKFIVVFPAAESITELIARGPLGAAHGFDKALPFFL